MPAVLSEDIQSEIEERGVSGLKHVPPPAEKVVLPSADDIVQERTEQALHHSIESFDKAAALRHADTEEKVVLPSKQDIEDEKKRLSSSSGAATEA